MLWGVYNGALLVGERLTGIAQAARRAARGPRRRAVTFLLVVLGWVLFRR